MLVRSPRAVAAAACFVALAGAAPASAGVSADEVRSNGRIVEATFNRPAPGTTDTYVTDHLRNLIVNAPPAATIKIALHSITGTGMKDAIVAEAPGRDGGGTVTVVYDGTKMGTVSTQLRDELRAAGGTFVQCGHNAGSLDDGGCLGTKTYSRQHAKYALISQSAKTTGTQGVGNYWGVVWMGSANVTGDSGWEAYNDAVTSYGDTDLYLGLEKTFDKAAANNWPSADFYDNPVGTGYAHGPNSNVTTWASPEDTAGNDLVLQRLNDVTPDGNCRIRVMQSLFNGQRGADIANKLVQLRRGGCWMWVLIDENSGGPALDSQVRSILCGNVAVRSYPNVHDKAFVIRGVYNGSMKDIVLTGSHNLTPEALRNNDEILTRVGASSGPIYSAYEQHFSSAYNSATTVC